MQDVARYHDRYLAMTSPPSIGILNEALPFTARPVHNGELPITLYEVDSQQGTPFTLDRLLHDAIMFCIDPSRDLWIAYESDREVQKVTGELRGWFRLELTSDKDRLGALSAWAGAHFPVARLVVDAVTGRCPSQPQGIGPPTTAGRPYASVTDMPCRPHGRNLWGSVAA